MTELTATRLRELFHYGPFTGAFTRLQSRGSAAAGPVRGIVHPQGYLRFNVDGKIYFAHRLAWLYVHGVWPAGHVDHINGDPADNRIINLREVTRSMNQQNQRRARADSSTGFLGVRNYRGGRFKADIWTDGKTKHLGVFDTAEEAHQAYLQAKRELHPGCTI